MIKCIQAEWLKSKKSIVIWLLVMGGTVVNLAVSVIYMLGEESLVALNENPWVSYMGRNLKSLSMFFWTPFLILLISAFINLEHKAKNWKNLFMLPTPPVKIVLSKLILLLLYVIFILFIHNVILLFSPTAINAIHPEYEFYFYTPDYTGVLVLSGKLFVLSWGIIGLQFVLSLFFENQIIALGIGFIAFILGFLLTIQDHALANYFPYSFPSMVSFKATSTSYMASSLLLGVCTLIAVFRHRSILNS